MPPSRHAKPECAKARRGCRLAEGKPHGPNTSIQPIDEHIAAAYAAALARSPRTLTSPSARAQTSDARVNPWR
jgi:hypothetical protein